MTDKRAVVVRGGWEGHQPVEATDLFLPFLRENGYDVQLESSPAIYADSAAMAAADLIVQCVTMSTIERDQVAGLRTAVEAGTGFTGWHGGIADSYRAASDYLQLVGGQFATHPGRHPDERTDAPSDNYLDYTVEITPLGREHPDHRGPRGLPPHDRAVLGAARRPERRSGDHHAPGASVAPVASSRHLAGHLDAGSGARAASS